MNDAVRLFMRLSRANTPSATIKQLPLLEEKPVSLRNALCSESVRQQVHVQDQQRTDRSGRDLTPAIDSCLPLTCASRRFWLFKDVIPE
ncbi:hypothetical protein KC356_g336 [Hortaea werneckii]|nr:hypothetical protein KC356_g336 [Hortaea werneckii]